MQILRFFDDIYLKREKIMMPYIIAEAGVNHEGDFDLARRLIDEAAESGANAVKFQTYKAETIASKYSPAYWDLSKEPTKSQFSLFKKYDGFWKNEFEQLKSYCDIAGIEFMSTPFDTESATFLNELMDVFKISSSDITNKPFIEFICEFNKPIILSTGASFVNEIDEAVGWIENKNVPVALLHCILNYPTDNTNANLGMITDLLNKYPDKLIGYSDHTLPNNMKVLEVATLLGARIIEKHFTHDKNLEGNDHYHAMDKEDLKGFINSMEKVLSIIGENKKFSLESELPARENARRSLIAACDIPVGETITVDHLTWKRPGVGISPKDIEKVIGRKTIGEIFEDEMLTWEKLK